MNERPCIRCHQTVPREEGQLVFCPHCGAPQIFLSEELQADLAQRAHEYEQRSAPEAAPAANATAASRWTLRRARPGGAAQAWPVAVHYALLTAAVTLALGLVSILLPPLEVLLLLWVLGAPVLTVTLVNRQASSAAPDSGFAARLGLLTAVLVAFSCAAVFTISLVLRRYVLHDTALFDAQLAASFAQQRELALQRLGASVQPTLNLFSIPEFRVGVMLLGGAIFGGLYVIVSTLAAGVTGLVLRRRPLP